MPKLIPHSKIARFFCIIGLIGLLFIAVTGVLFWQMSKVMGEDMNGLENDEWPYLHTSITDKQSEHNLKFVEILERYPDLKPEWRNVSDEDNGFLQLLNLCEYVVGANGSDAEYRVTLSEELRREVGDVVSEEDFAGGERFTALYKELERIAESEERSCAGIDPHRLISSKTLKLVRSFTDILLYDAKLAADTGDKEKALSRVRTAVRIVEHFSQIETQSLMGVTVLIVCEQSIVKTVFNDLLPKLELSQESYKEWRNVITSRHIAITLEQMSMGEFNLATPVLSVPICEKVWLFQLTGIDKVYDAIAEMHLELVRLYSEGYKSYIDGEKMDKVLATKNAESFYVARLLVQQLCLGWSLFTKSVIGSAAKFRHFDAALAHLSGEELPLELITGKPFVLDAEKQILSMPSDPLLEEFCFEPIDFAKILK